jgi:hypothetical protein
METLEQTLWVIHNWSITRVNTLLEDPSEDQLIDVLEDAYSIQQEFAEWLNPDTEDHDVVSLEYIGDEDGGNI